MVVLRERVLWVVAMLMMVILYYHVYLAGIKQSEFL